MYLNVFNTLEVSWSHGWCIRWFCLVKCNNVHQSILGLNLPPSVAQHQDGWKLFCGSCWNCSVGGLQEERGAVAKLWCGPVTCPTKKSRCWNQIHFDQSQFLQFLITESSWIMLNQIFGKLSEWIFLVPRCHDRSGPGVWSFCKCSICDVQPMWLPSQRLSWPVERPLAWHSDLETTKIPWWTVKPIGSMGFHVPKLICPSSFLSSKKQTMILLE